MNKKPPDRQLRVWWSIAKRVLRVFLVLWMTALGGIVGANLLAVIGTQFFVSENKGIYVQPWAHAGWYIGTVLFFFGAATGRLRFLNGGSESQPAGKTESQSLANAEPVSPQPTEGVPEEQCGFFQGILVGGLAGGFLGLLLGANLLVFWFSLAYSPFAPQKVASSVKVERERQPGSVWKRPVMKSSHPVSIYLCLTPAALGALTGAAAAGVLYVKYGRDTTT